jgi:hypothetical protein
VCELFHERWNIEDTDVRKLIACMLEESDFFSHQKKLLGKKVHILLRE